MKNVQITYDVFADVLYISFKKVRSTIINPISDCDLICLDSNTKKIVGLTLIAYKERFKTDPPKEYKGKIKTIANDIISQHQSEFD